MLGHLGRAGPLAANMPRHKGSRLRTTATAGPATLIGMKRGRMPSSNKANGVQGRRTSAGRRGGGSLQERPARKPLRATCRYLSVHKCLKNPTYRQHHDICGQKPPIGGVRSSPNTLWSPPIFGFSKVRASIGTELRLLVKQSPGPKPGCSCKIGLANGKNTLPVPSNKPTRLFLAALRQLGLGLEPSSEAMRLPNPISPLLRED